MTTEARDRLRRVVGEMDLLRGCTPPSVQAYEALANETPGVDWQDLYALAQDRVAREFSYGFMHSPVGRAVVALYLEAYLVAARFRREEAR